MSRRLGGLRYALVGLVVVAAALVVATSGAPGSDIVTADETDVLEMTPHADAQGVYTSIDDDGEIQIHIADIEGGGEGVNPESIYDFGGIFTIENVADDPVVATVWLNHDSDHVAFHDPDGQSLEGGLDEGLLGGDSGEVPENAVGLAPDESVTVALTVDSRGTDEITLKSFNVVATLDGLEEDEEIESISGGGDLPSSGSSGTDDSPSGDGTEGDGSGGGEGGEGGAGPIEPTPTPTPEPTPTEDQGAIADEPVDTPVEFAGVSAWWLGIIAGLLGLFVVLLVARRRWADDEGA